MEKRKKIIIIILILILLLLGIIIFAISNSKEELIPENKDKEIREEDVIDEEDISKDESIIEDENNVSNNESSVNTSYLVLASNNNDSKSKNQIEQTTTIVTSDFNYYMLALKAISKAETTLDEHDLNIAKDFANKVTSSKKQNLLNRIQTIQEFVDFNKLLKELENLANSATNKEELDVARAYNLDNNLQNKLNDLPNTTSKFNIVSRYNKVLSKLNDTAAPVITGIENGEYTNKDITLSITDESLFTATLDGKEFKVGDQIPEGDHTLYVVDESFNEITITFKLDKTAPKLNASYWTKTIEGNRNATEFTDLPIVEGTDIGSGKVTVELVNNDVNLKVPGDYKLQYKTTDQAGNSSYNDIFIKVVDTTAPELTITNWQNLTLEVGDTYIDEGATAYDLVDGDLTDKIEVSYLYYDSEGKRITPDPTEIKLDQVGQFIIKYRVTDNAGNSKELVRRINVKKYELVSALVNGEKIIFSSFEELFNNIPDNAETNITLEKDYNEDIVIPKGKILNLNLNNKTLTGNKNITNNGILSISNGTINSLNNAIINNEKITSIDNVTINSERTGINNNGIIDSVTNSTIDARFYPIYLSGSTIGELANNYVTGHYQSGIYLSGASTINKITSGTYITYGDKPDFGSSISGFGLYISTNSVVDEIAGGFFQGNQVAVANYGSINLISGGTFEKKIENNVWTMKWTFGYTGKINNITGGKFYSYTGELNGVFRANNYNVDPSYELVKDGDYFIAKVK